MNWKNNRSIISHKPNIDEANLLELTKTNDRIIPSNWVIISLDPHTKNSSRSNVYNDLVELKDTNDIVIPLENKKKNKTEQSKNFKKNVILKDEDDEFNYLYGNTMMDIKFEFLDYIQYNAFPFLENQHHIKSPTFYDFLRHNSPVYNSLANSIQNKNRKIIRLINNKEKLNKIDIEKIDYLNNIDDIEYINNINNIDNLDNLEILDNSDEEIDNINYNDNKTFY